MTIPFSQLLSSASFKDDVLRVDISEDWMQGRTTYGGLSAALCLETALRAFEDLPPLRSANVSFIGPAGGAVEGRAKELRRGKSVSFVEADLTGEASLATRCTFAFGAARESMFNETWTPPPSGLPGPEDCEVFIPKGLGPNFATHFDTGLAKGARPGAGSKEHDHYIWVRHTDDVTGPVALLALADMPPPAVMPMFPVFKPISSMTWMLNILSDAPRTRDGWWLLQSRAENASNGYSSQDMLIWNRDMELVVAGRQSVAIFL